MKKVTVVTWAFAPEWLTLAQAAELSGYSEDFLLWLLEDGAFETRQAGDAWLIEKASLRDYQDALLDIKDL